MRSAAHERGAEVVLVGILPTLRKSDLAMAHMTPRPRYRALNAVLTQLRGGDYEFRLKGADELSIRHDSVMLESGCTSFQVHYQVEPAEFAQCYNLAQLVNRPAAGGRGQLAAPVRAAGCGARRASRCSSSPSTRAGRAITCASAPPG